MSGRIDVEGFKVRLHVAGRRWRVTSDGYAADDGARVERSARGRWLAYAPGDEYPLTRRHSRGGSAVRTWASAGAAMVALRAS